MRLTSLASALLVAACLGSPAFAADGSAISPDEQSQGFVSLFDGKTLNGWQGDTKGYVARDGMIVCEKQKGGMLLTEKEYGNFVFRFDFRFEPGGNNGVAVRTPRQGNPAYAGMEIQILDDGHEKYKGWLKDYQHHGSIYGVVAAKTGHLKPAGQWNSEEIACDGTKIKITLNGTVIVDADLSKIEKPIDGQAHPGLKRDKGFLGFCGHGDQVEFRNLRVKELK